MVRHQRRHCGLALLKHLLTAQVCSLLHQRYSEFGTELNASLKQLLASDARSGGALDSIWRITMLLGCAA